MNIHVNGTDVHYELAGPATAPVVTCVHSFLANLSMWDGQADALHDYRLLRYDLRGHGRSQAAAEGCAIETWVEDIVALLDALEISATHFVGSSLGGMIGQRLAIDHSNRIASLTLCSTRAEPSAKRSGEAASRLAAVKAGGLDSIAESVLEEWFSEDFRKSSPEATGTAREMILSTPTKGVEKCWDAMRHHDSKSMLGKIQVPTLVIVGEQDPVTPLAEAFELHVAIDGSDMVVIPGTRHLPNVEKAAEFNEVLTAFIRKHC